MDEDPTKTQQLVESLESDADVIPIDKKQKLVEASPTTGMSEEGRKLFWSQALMKLTESRRFLEFIDANYTIGIHKDEETKTVDVLVVEKPVAVGPRLSSDQLFRLGRLCMASGARESSKLLEAICKTLGQDPPAIILATEGDAKRVVEDAGKVTLDDE